LEYYSKADALLSLLPNAEFVWDGKDRKYEDLRMISGTKPAEDAINTEHTRLNEKESYKMKRLVEYPDFGTQLDYIYHNGLDKWKTDIVDPVKAKYPKPD
jgi:hypothetical protein